MPRPVAGRRPDSLFDNRYRYDFIYPRGRSGETLRAYDTQDDDRPVVIKRPALQDAPPIRAGQEVNILNEQRALELLSGHPILTELRYSGTFRVGGQAHHYIVMDMAGGETVEQMVLHLAERGQRLPDLEMLNILDGLLDLLQTAHDKGMIYNDVDAKHLFWDQEEYQLKVIDWGNVVFLDSENAPPHINRATDILQVGELLYFILSGGHRLESGRLDPANDLPEDVPLRIRFIINRAVHPDSAMRYPDIRALRNELAEVRRPMQRQRDSLVERVRGRLPLATNHSQLEDLRAALGEALRLDPGYPQARELEHEIERRLRQIAVQGDLDAVRIYIESGNIARANQLIDEIQERGDLQDSPAMLFLGDVCELLTNQGSASSGLPLVIPEGLMPALDALLRADVPTTARTLVTTPDPRTTARHLQMLMAERLCQRMPGLMLLRPHFVRLEDELLKLPGGDRLLSLVRSIEVKLNEPVQPGIQNLRRAYQRAADTLAAIEERLTSLPGNQEALTAAAHGREAADAIVDLIEVIGQNSVSDTSRAGNAFWHAQAIDPANPAFDALNVHMSDFHSVLEEVRGFTPATDGADIADYLARVERRLQVYTSDVPDLRYQAMLEDVDTARRAWIHLTDNIALGGKSPAVESCRQAAQAVRSFNPNLSRWFEENAHRIEETANIELLSPNTNFGKAMTDAWNAWDRGRGGEALMAAKRASDAAFTDAEKQAVRRVMTLSEALDNWLERDGPQSTPQTEATQRRINALYQPDEEALRARFAGQMPKMETYLKAMVKGVVEPLRDASSSAGRILFFDYVLRGILALQREQFEDAATWREAALKAMPHARVHPAYSALENGIARRQLVLEAVRALNHVRTLDDLAGARQHIRAPLATQQLESLEQSVRAIDEALRRWTDGDFRTAKQQLDIAIERAILAEAVFFKDLGDYKTWLQNMADTAEVLAQARRVIDEEALVPSEAPNPEVEIALEKLVNLTRSLLGESYTSQLRQWRDTYSAILDIYTDRKLSKDEKLRILEGHFASLFITRQPAMPIFRKWRDVIEEQPDGEPQRPPQFDYRDIESSQLPIAPPPRPRSPYDTAELPPPPDTPRPASGDAGASAVGAEEPDHAPPAERRMDRAERLRLSNEIRLGAAYDSPPPASPHSFGPVDTSNVIQLAPPTPPATAATGDSRRRRTLSTPMILFGLLVGITAIVVVVVTAQQSGVIGGTPTGNPALLANASPTIPPTQTPMPTNTLEITPTQPPATEAPSEIPAVVVTPTAIPPTLTPQQPVPTPSPLPTGELVAPTALSAVSSPSPAPTLSAGASPEPTNPGVALPTLPPDAQTGEYDVLAELAKLPAERRTWNTDWFAQRGGVWQVGNIVQRAGRAPLIRLGPDVLTALFGADAPVLLKRMDAELELVTYEKSLLPTGQVFFGAGFESPEQQRAAVEARLVEENVIDLGLNLNGTFRRRTQVPAKAVKVKLSVVRNADRTLSLLVDGQLLGQSNAAYAPDKPISLYLYTSTGGVLVKVNALTVKLEK